MAGRTSWPISGAPSPKGCSRFPRRSDSWVAQTCVSCRSAALKSTSAADKAADFETREVRAPFELNLASHSVICIATLKHREEKSMARVQEEDLTKFDLNGLLALAEETVRTMRQEGPTEKQAEKLVKVSSDILKKTRAGS